MEVKRYRQLGVNNRTDKLQDRIIQHREIPPLFCNINSFKWSVIYMLTYNAVHGNSASPAAQR